MYGSLPSFVLGFHGCDKSIALEVLSGKKELNPSNNPWDWLGQGTYFWEHDAILALAYAENVKQGKQFAKGRINTPFVLGAIIDLKNCWNLPTTGGIEILKNGYKGFSEAIKKIGVKMPENKSFHQRNLDCAVIEYIHELNKENDYDPYDTVRGAFPEGDPVYDGTHITEKNHIQICVRNKSCIKGYFLPQPVKEYNPHY